MSHHIPKDSLNNRNIQRNVSKDGCQDCQEECVPRTSECAFRKRNLKGEVNPKKVTTYEVDTCLISYKPRLITIGSKRYPTLDDALCALEPYKGGYVILLKEGVHCISASLCLSVDYLHFIGDCSNLVGVFFGNTNRLTPVDIHTICQNPDTTYGIVRVSVSGRTIRVRGSIKDPDFSTLCPGRRVSILHCDGTFTETFIDGVCGNSITLRTEPGFNPEVNPGEGFYIHPNVILTSRCVDLKILTTHRLIFEGLEIQIPFPFTAGTPGLYMDIRHSVLLNLHITGDYYITEPNVFLGLTVLTSDSNGQAVDQAFLGREARLLGDNNGTATWYRTWIVSTINGSKMINRGNINLFGSNLINNCLALQVHAGSNATIQGVSFENNRFAVVAFYGSNVSSYHIDGDPEESFRPYFFNNFVAANVGYNSHMLVPNSIMDNNTHAFIIDSQFRSTLESNPVGNYGPYYSIVIPIVNPVAPDKLTSLACVGGTDCTDFLAGDYNNVKSSHGTVTHSTIANTCPVGSGGLNSGNIGASGVGTLTGTAGSMFGTVCNEPSNCSALCNGNGNGNNGNGNNTGNFNPNNNPFSTNNGNNTNRNNGPFVSSNTVISNAGLSNCLGAPPVDQSGNNTFGATGARFGAPAQFGNPAQFSNTQFAATAQFNNNTQFARSGVGLGTRRV